MGDRIGSFPDSGRFKGVFRGGAESEQGFEAIGLEEVADFLVRFFLIFSQFIHLTKNEDWGAIFLARKTKQGRKRSENGVGVSVV